METAKSYSKQQLDLFESLPHKPYCMDEKPGFMQIRPKKLAVTKPYIQVNPPVTLVYLVFDIDRNDASVCWYDENLPKPFWTAQNPAEIQDPSDEELEHMGRGHLCYMLKLPVCTSDMGSIKAIKYAQSIYYAYSLRLGADLSYSHMITKNPLHKHWRTTFWTDQAYSLDYLADFVDLPKKIPPKLEVVGLGRNCTIFEKGRRWAYKAIRDYMHYNSSYEWEKAVRAHLDAINDGFEEPLLPNEVKATAKSIARWVWQRFSYGDFSEIQAKRGAKGGKKGGAVRSAQYQLKRIEAAQLKAKGMNNTQIAKQLGVSRMTVIRWFEGCNSEPYQITAL